MQIYEWTELSANEQRKWQQKLEVPWKNLVRQKKGIPKFKTPTWLFILDRCTTRNRLISWGLQSDPTCLLCNSEPESRDHLFFCCDYSFSVWGTLARNLNLLLPSNSWNDTLEALINLNGDRHLRFLITLAWQASIYELWRERNNRLHRKVYRSSSAILSSIKAVIKNRISSFRDINGGFSSTTMQLWFASVWKGRSLFSQAPCSPTTPLQFLVKRKRVSLGHPYTFSIFHYVLQAQLAIFSLPSLYLCSPGLWSVHVITLLIWFLSWGFILGFY